MIEFIKKLMAKLKKRKSKTNDPNTWFEGSTYFKSESEIRFDSLTIFPKAPSNELIGEKEFVIVIYKRKKYWALFRCPCGCGHVISLNLQQSHKPNWSVRSSKDGRPTLSPSVWQNKGCKSHFWISDGRIFWCNSTGEYPWESKY